MPVVPGTDSALESADEAKAFAASAGYPVILKARSGGGGRGMRVVRSGGCGQGRRAAGGRGCRGYLPRPGAAARLPPGVASGMAGRVGMRGL